MARIFYSGDVNIENGGYFYSLKNWQFDYVDAVRVTPCSDADGPDNCYWVDMVTVNLRKGAELERALQCIGQSIADLPKNACKRHIIIDACLSYGYCDVDSMAVQIGAKQSEYGEPIRVEKVLRANVSLYRYARGLLAMSI